MSASYLTSKDRPGHTTPLAAYRASTELSELRKNRQQLASRLRLMKPRCPRRNELELRLRELTTTELNLSNRVDPAMGKV